MIVVMQIHLTVASVSEESILGPLEPTMGIVVQRRDSRSKAKYIVAHELGMSMVEVAAEGSTK